MITETKDDVELAKTFDKKLMSNRKRFVFSMRSASKTRRFPSQDTSKCSNRIRTKWLRWWRTAVRTMHPMHRRIPPVITFGTNPSFVYAVFPTTPPKRTWWIFLQVRFSDFLGGYPKGMVGWMDLANYDKRRVLAGRVCSVSLNGLSDRKKDTIWSVIICLFLGLTHLVGLDIAQNGVHISSSKPAGEAFVAFMNMDNAHRALGFNRKNIGHRYGKRVRESLSPVFPLVRVEERQISSVTDRSHVLSSATITSVP